VNDPDTATPKVEAERVAHKARGDEMLASLKEGVKTIVGAVLIALVLRSFGYEPFNIPSESMLPRLLVGDYLFVAKWPYGYSRYSFPLGPPIFDGRIAGRSPERGDIAVFKDPRDNRTDFIKRVIGMPGDIVQMRGGMLFLNGVEVPKRRVADFVVPVSENMLCLTGERFVDTAGTEQCRYLQFEETLPGGISYRVLDTTPASRGDDTAPFVVPDGHYFMMGDNRDNSADSRFSFAEDGISFVPGENLVGRAEIMFFSTDGSSSWLLPWTWFTAARWERIGRTF
jgi:signal peptidase I